MTGDDCNEWLKCDDNIHRGSSTYRLNIAKFVWICLIKFEMLIIIRDLNYIVHISVSSGY